MSGRQRWWAKGRGVGIRMVGIKMRMEEKLGRLVSVAADSPVTYAAWEWQHGVTEHECWL